LNQRHVRQLRDSFERLRERQRKEPLPDVERKMESLRKIREFSVGNKELLDRTIERMKKNGLQIYQANDTEEALNHLQKEVGEKRLVVKSKSNITKEIRLTQALRERDIVVIETDIGDRIAQLIDTPPSHPTGPITHLNAKDISEGLSRTLGMPLSDKAEDIVNFIRDDVSTYIRDAEIGITGANALTAEEGAIILAHNEGNIYEVMRKEKHIILTGIDKIYPTIEDAFNMLKILSYNATGSIITSFVEVISGVSKTADVEKRFVRGIHNPKDVVIIIIDNGRSDIINSPFKEILYCIDCGNCLVYCPVYNTIGFNFADGKNLGGKGIAISSIKGEAVKKRLQYCLTCGRCKKHCPVRIDIPGIIRGLRSKHLAQEGYYFLKSHLLWLYYSFRLIL